jgi:hypothetical protein
MSELGISPNTTTGRKIDDLAKALETLAIEDDAKEIIEGHLRELKRDAVKPQSCSTPPSRSYEASSQQRTTLCTIKDWKVKKTR